MDRRGQLVLLSILALGVHLTTDAALAAVPCGSIDPDSQRIARAALTLDENSVTTQAFKRSSNPKTLLLIFKAAGCELGSQGEPRVNVLPKQGANEIPEGVVMLRTVDMDTAELSLRLGVDATKFDPGSYGGLVEVRGPYLVTSRIPISISRSESREWIPGVIGAAAGIVGFLWFSLLKIFGGSKLEIKWWWLSFVGAAACALGAYAVLTAYWDQEVWTVDANLWAAIVAGISGATTGAMVTMLGVVWQAAK